MYDFITHTWNTIKGQCPHGCTYCYMKKWGKQKPIRLDESEFKTDLGTGNFIFVGSSNDIFAKDIPREWTRKTLNHCLEYGNRYLFQSKNPSGMLNYLDQLMDMDTIVCTTIETNRWYPTIMKNSPKPQTRANGIAKLNFHRYITIEPILDFDEPQLLNLIKQCNPRQVNIGADSGNNNLPEPTLEKVLSLIDKLKTFTTVSQKKNLNRLLKGQKI